MGTAMDMRTTLPRSRPLTRADLDEVPDDGHRYELIDGVLVVSPSPRIDHQRMVGALYVALRAACPSQLEVVLGPFDVVLANDTVLVPDLIVAARDQLAERDHPGAPILSIEVLSPSTRRFDQLVKRDRLQSAAVGAYWLVDPEGASITVLELREGVLVEVAWATGDAALDVSFPFPLSLTPSPLLS